MVKLNKCIKIMFFSTFHCGADLEDIPPCALMEWSVLLRYGIPVYGLHNGNLIIVVCNLKRLLQLSGVSIGEGKS